MLDISNKEAREMIYALEDRVNGYREKEEKLMEIFEVVESLMDMEIAAAKKSMKAANMKGEARDFEYRYGQVSGLGTARCCLKKALEMSDGILQSQELLFFPENRCSFGSYSDEQSMHGSGFMSLNTIMYEIFLDLLRHRMEPIPATVYEAFYNIALDRGYPTELYFKSVANKPEKTAEDRKILRTAVTCEEIASEGDRWYGAELTARYKQRGFWK
jgi:hypothetical protein